ncbi:cyclic pyranopterin monophosphate synthase MoaC [Lewinellaceae bacterium SD302]|nr:cyclic pyranopterin monophosphate synthase MoaC [Lewinellaceae bacterium SD302]
MKNYTHLDQNDQPGMVDVSAKAVTARSATATVTVELGPEITVELTELGFETKKGSIIQTAIIAGTLAAKKTAEAIPLCHNIPLSSVKFATTIVPEVGLRLEATAKTNANTGVEMEALHAASVAALTVYDMCKSRSQSIRISDLKLLQKRGGKSDYDASETP